MGFTDRKTSGLPVIHLDGESCENKDAKKLMGLAKQQIFKPDFSIDMISEMTGLSRFKISRIIYGKYNLPFKHLVNCIRLNEAKRLLLESDLKIYDIAYKTGYNNYTYFCTLFKHEYGCTPMEYRSRESVSG
jgi:AraC-like DNA-binding protein